MDYTLSPYSLLGSTNQLSLYILFIFFISTCWLKSVIFSSHPRVTHPPSLRLFPNKKSPTSFLHLTLPLPLRLRLPLSKKLLFFFSNQLHVPFHLIFPLPETHGPIGSDPVRLRTRFVSLNGRRFRHRSSRPRIQLRRTQIAVLFLRRFVFGHI